MAGPQWAVAFEIYFSNIYAYARGKMNIKSIYCYFVNQILSILFNQLLKFLGECTGIEFMVNMGIESAWFLVSRAHHGIDETMRYDF